MSVSDHVPIVLGHPGETSIIVGCAGCDWRDEDGYDFVAHRDIPHLGWWEHVAAAQASSLDAAWAEAEAALPKGQGYELQLDRFQCADGSVRMTASAGHWDCDGHQWQGPTGEGATPAAALRALTTKLRGEA